MPKQHSSGGKSRLGSITKQGDRYLRGLFVAGALAVIRYLEFISYAKVNPGKLSKASFGTGAISHAAGKLFKMMAAVNTLHVPYRGSSPMLTDLLAGQVQAAVDNLPASIGHIRPGKLRALAVMTALRSQTLPDVPDR